MNVFGGGLNYTGLMVDIQQLCKLYPYIDTGSIGNTVCGREIPYLRIGRGAKEIHFNGAFHANEWITTPMLIQFIKEYADAYSHGKLLYGVDARELYYQSSLWVVPMVNPDGVELILDKPPKGMEGRLMQWNGGSADFSGWKANIRGVDLNDQFPANWEMERDRRQVTNPGPRDYTGIAPETEQEAIAMVKFTRERDFSLVIAFHTQGEEIYWNYNGLEPAISERIAERLAEVSGYRAIKLTGSDAGYKDWFIQEFRRPGFTVELGSGSNPLPYLEFDQIYPKAAAIMVEALRT
ncbi:M14 family metallopeptidase [Paenibacillus agricola]|nr:M14 family metallocarboxypeptidase [Paenibacillus agricola]